jgi:hypothetical protein
MDPDLERLVADMSVAQTPVPRRIEGVGGRTHFRENEQGTLDDSTAVSGVPVTVLSNGIPSEVNMREGQAGDDDTHGANGKRFKIFVVPRETSSTLCFQLIGQGASFCTARNCATAHHHASVKRVKPGDIYIAKSSTTAFVTPSITTDVIDDGVLASWRTLNLPLSTWIEKFFIATAASDEVPASSAAMEVHETYYHTKALNFKTPAKRKRGADDSISPTLPLLDVNVYSPFFKEDEVTPPITDIDHVSGVLARLEGGITANNLAIINFIEDYKGEHGKAGDSIRSMWLRLEALTAAVGEVPAKLAFDYLSPSAWASIGALAEKLDVIGKTQATQSSRLESYKKEIRATMTNQIELSREDFYQRLESFKTAFISASRSLGGRLDNVELRLIGIDDNSGFGTAPTGSRPARHPNAQYGRSGTVDPLSQAFEGGRSQREAIDLDDLDDQDSRHKIARVELRVDLMEQKVLGLISKSDERAIQFANLGFLSSMDSNAWLAKELPRYQSGLIVDAHMVFENVYHAINGFDTLATMEKLYKIKVSCIADSVAMTSFENKIPKYFAKENGIKVLKQDASYFNAITSHSDWSDAETGFKVRLQETMAEFEVSHAALIDQAVENGSKAHVLAHAALTESVAWVIKFIQFIDEYYRELSKAKFGPTKGWHVTTRLAKRILDEIGTPRYGIQASFQVGDSTQICQQIFWSVLRSHDVMTEFKRLNFKNHPSIATELVKFLAINTSFEAIDKLTTKSSYLEIEVLDYKKQIAAAVKAAASSANKADEAKKLSDLLTKRLTKLEERVAKLG